MKAYKKTFLLLALIVSFFSINALANPNPWPDGPTPIPIPGPKNVPEINTQSISLATAILIGGIILYAEKQRCTQGAECKGGAPEN